jgi:hypothetical protein
MKDLIHISGTAHRTVKTSPRQGATVQPMTTNTPAWKWALAFAMVALGATIAIPLYRYADADDAPGGMVIAFLIFILGAVLATWIVGHRPKPTR